MAKKRVLGVVGMGHVGAHVAYALAIQGIADELVLVDQNEQKLASEVQDLRDAVAYMPHRVTVRGGDFSDLGVCDIIVNSVGKIDLLRGTHDRVTEMDFTIPAVRGYAEKIKASGFDGVLINITGSEDMGLEDVETAASMITQSAHPDANIIWGTAFDERLSDEMSITVVATGFESTPEVDEPIQAHVDAKRAAQAATQPAAQPAAAPVQPVQPAQPQVNPVMPNPIFTQSFSTGMDTPVAAQPAAPAEEEDDGDYFDDLLSILNKRS